MAPVGAGLGFESAPSSYESAAPTGVEFAFARWRIQFPAFLSGARAVGPRDGSQVGAGITDVHLDAGYDFLRWRGLTGFALAGTGVTSFSLDAHGAHWSYVTDRATGVGGADRAKQDAWMFSGQLGFEQLVPLGRASANELWALAVSLRGGYLAQLANAGWATSDGAHTVAGLPAVDLGGAWVSLTSPSVRTRPPGERWWPRRLQRVANEAQRLVHRRRDAEHSPARSRQKPASDSDPRANITCAS